MPNLTKKSRTFYYRQLKNDCLGLFLTLTDQDYPVGNSESIADGELPLQQTEPVVMETSEISDSDYSYLSDVCYESNSDNEFIQLIDVLDQIHQQVFT